MLCFRVTVIQRMCNTLATRDVHSLYRFIYIDTHLLDELRYFGRLDRTNRSVQVRTAVEDLLASDIVWILTKHSHRVGPTRTREERLPYILAREMHIASPR